MDLLAIQWWQSTGLSCWFPSEPDTVEQRLDLGLHHARADIADAAVRAVGRDDGELAAWRNKSHMPNRRPVRRPLSPKVGLVAWPAGDSHV